VDKEQFNINMTELSQNDKNECYKESFEQAHALKEEVLKEVNPDPSQIGWALFYEFKGLYKIKKYEEAYDLLNSTKPYIYMLTENNASWMQSVGAELAMHLGRPKDIIRHGQECIDLRLKANNLDSAFSCANNVCLFLKQIQEVSLNSEFAKLFIKLGEAFPGRVLQGYKHLVDNIEVSQNMELIHYVIKRLPALKTMKVGVGSEIQYELFDLINKIETAEWYRKSINEQARHKFDIGVRLRKTADSGDIADIDELFEEGVDINQINYGFQGVPTALIVAAFGGHLLMVQKLLEKKPDMDIQNTNGRTALLLAADQGHVDIIKLLAKAGAKLNHVDVFGQTALHLASWQNHCQSVQALIEAGADLEEKTKDGYTSLALSVTEKVPEVLKMLIEAGADIESRNICRQTPLIIAAANGMLDNVLLLLEYGADIKVVDEEGMSAADWAKKEECYEVEKVLIAKGKKKKFSKLKQGMIPFIKKLFK
jgi:ankyrin repeat protein